MQGIERGIARAEIIERDGDAERLDLAKDVECPQPVGNDRGLGDLQFQPMRWKPESSSAPVTISTRSMAMSWIEESLTAIRQGSGQRAASSQAAQDPLADPHDLPIPFRDRNEFGRRDPATAVNEYIEKLRAAGHTVEEVSMPSVKYRTRDLLHRVVPLQKYQVISLAMMGCDTDDAPKMSLRLPNGTVALAMKAS